MNNIPTDFVPSAGRIISGTSGNTALMDAGGGRGVERKREFEVQVEEGRKEKRRKKKRERVDGAFSTLYSTR